MEVLNDYTSESAASLKLTENERNNILINSDQISQPSTSSLNLTSNYSMNDSNEHKY